MRGLCACTYLIVTRLCFGKGGNWDAHISSVPISNIYRRRVGRMYTCNVYCISAYRRRVGRAHFVNLPPALHVHRQGIVPTAAALVPRGSVAGVNVCVCVCVCVYCVCVCVCVCVCSCVSMYILHDVPGC